MSGWKYIYVRFEPRVGQSSRVDASQKLIYSFYKGLLISLRTHKKDQRISPVQENKRCSF